MITSILLLTLSPASAPQQLATHGQNAPEATLTWADFDGDGLDDVLATTADAPDRLLRNLGDGSFEDVGEASGLAPRWASRVVRWGDHDGDGDLDLMRIGADGRVELSTNSGGHFTPESGPSQLAAIDSARDGRWLDYDQDGLLDLQLTCTGGDLLFHNRGGGLLQAVDLGAGTGPSAAPGPVLAAPHPAATTTPGSGPGKLPSGQLPPTPPPAAPGPGSGATSMPPPTAAPGSGFCPEALVDQAMPGAACITASSTPTSGSLYPLGQDLMIDASSGFVGIGTLSPAASLDVNGLVRARVGGYEFPDGSVQTTACDCSAIWAAITLLQEGLGTINSTLSEHGGRIAAAEDALDDLASTTTTLRDDVDNIQQRVSDSEDVVGGLTDTVGVMLTSLTSLEYLTSPLAYDGTILALHGANFQITDGTSGASSPNGLGNLILGHNRDLSGYLQSGSHNLVIGDDHSFRGFAGLVSGTSNRLLADNTAILGGRQNEVYTDLTTIVGGSNGTVSGSSEGAVVLGGSSALISSSPGGVALGGNMERLVGYSPDYSKASVNFDEIHRAFDGILTRLDDLEGP
ncbi:MAG: FG-GAP-like repeat-containing protein [Planctomycetota bacterium]|nr:FG-GAP-like repeat-containing protein [Planctomycetota bacterium]